MFVIFGTPIIRAINNKEADELLLANDMKDIRSLEPGVPYEFTIHEGTIWCDKIGDKRWSISQIAVSDKRLYSGIVLVTKLARRFTENPGELGKYYCTSTHKAEVFLFVGKWRW